MVSISGEPGSNPAPSFFSPTSGRRIFTPDAPLADGYYDPMRPTPTRVLLLGGALFLLGTLLLFLWMEGGSSLLMGLGIGTITVSALTLAVAGRWMRRNRDPLETRREQRLWRSGPLGRWWLEKRKRLP